MNLMSNETMTSSPETTKSYFSKEQLADYDKNGFLLVKGMYSSQEITHMISAVEELCSREPEIGKQMAYFENSLKNPDEKVISRVEKFVEHQETLHSFVYGEKMLKAVEELLDDTSVLFKEKINFKMPGGGGFEAHQDIQPGWANYASYFLSVLVTIDPSTKENGCLELAAGHHKKGMLGKEWEPLHPEQLQGVEFVEYPTEPGDVVFFDCFVPHLSKPNLTEKPRRNMYLTFNRMAEGDHREQYFADKRASFPPDYERENGKEYKFRV